MYLELLLYKASGKRMCVPATRLYFFYLFMIANPTLTLSDLSEYEVNPMTLYEFTK